MIHRPAFLASAIFVLAFGCAPQSAPTVSPEIRFAMPAGSSDLIDAAIESFRKDLGGITFSRTDTPGTVAGATYVDQGKAETTLIPSDIAYIAFTSGTETDAYPHRRLRGIAMLHMIALHLLVAPGVEYSDIKDLRGRRVGVGPPQSGTDFTVRTVLPLLGVSLSDIQAETLSFGRMAERLGSGTLDMGFVFLSYPAPLVQSALDSSGARLFPIGGPTVPALREHYPFLRPVMIPAGAYGQPDDIPTLGGNWMLVCRDDVDEEIVYDMLASFFDEIPDLARVRPALHTVSFDRAPESPIPLHPGAARFYRERQLFR